MSLPEEGQNASAPSVRPITTYYAGCRFRSRLEARWAVFFDELYLPWEYEPEGYVVDGIPYLPDFWLPRQNLHYEIKPSALLRDYRERLSGLAEGGKRRLAMAAGPMPDPARFYPATVDDDAEFFMEVYYPDGNVDERHAWGKCEACGVIDVQWQGNVDRTCGHSEGRSAWNHPDILAAYRAARSARFEHGESGAR